MHRKKWVVNASPLIILAKVDQILLLKDLCEEMTIPSGVKEEIDEGPENDPARIWLKSDGEKWVRGSGPINPVISAWDLGQGETEVLNWAYEHPGYEAILDDKAAKNCASSVHIKVHGTIGIILLAKQEGIIEKVSPILNRLPKVGFRIQPPILAAAKKLAHE
jgi:predicted nucleic acid-binding protein